MIVSRMIVSISFVFLIGIVEASAANVHIVTRTYT